MKTIITSLLLATAAATLTVVTGYAEPKLITTFQNYTYEVTERAEIKTTSNPVETVSSDIVETQVEENKKTEEKIDYSNAKIEFRIASSTVSNQPVGTTKDESEKKLTTEKKQTSVITDVIIEKKNEEESQEVVEDTADPVGPDPEETATTESIVNNAPSTSDNQVSLKSEEAAPARVEEVKVEPVVSTAKYTNTIVFPNGSVIPFVESVNPSQDQRYIDSNIAEATTWYTAPVFNGNDNANTYFAAHTATFRYLLSSSYGDVITIYDNQGNAFSYQIIMVDDMNDDTLNRKAKSIWESYMNADYGSGEYASFQTCIDNFWNRVVKAKRVA